MGWYLRKSFRFGPVRLNLSKSGLGYSFGIKGARIGSGPRGNYIHMGRYGLYYRQSLPSSAGAARATSERTLDTPVEPPVWGTVIATADATTLTDSSSEQLLSYIRDQHQKASVAPWTTASAVLLLVAMFANNIATWALLASCIATVAAYFVISAFDRERKRVVLRYRLDDVARSRYEGFSKALQALSSSKGLWRIMTRDLSLRPKYTSGATQLINRKKGSMSKAAPSNVEADVPTWELALGDQTLYFFPDRILVYQGSWVGRQIGAVAYAGFSATAYPTRFVETGPIPDDARVVDRTWRYVNKKGGPDRRFANNREIPVAEYGQIVLTSGTGMNLLVHSSNVAASRQFAEGVTQYCSEIVSSSHIVEAPKGATGSGEETDVPIAHPLLTRWGWVAAPVLLAWMVVAFESVPRAVRTTPTATATAAAGPNAEGNVPELRILSKKGTRLVVAVPPQTSDTDLRRLLLELRDEVGGHKPGGLGIRIPASQTTGTILIFRNRNKPVGNLHESDAAFTWNAKGQTATLRTVGGARVTVF